MTRRRWLRRSFALPEKIPLRIDSLDIEINSVAKGGPQFNPVSSDISGAHLWLILMKAYRALSQVDARSIADSGLGMSDFAVLEVLLHKGPLPVNTIGGHVMLTSGSITTAVDRLEAKRLVRRKPCPEDRRVTYVSLTRTGSTLIRRIFKVHADRLEALFEPLTVTERASLGTLLKKIGRHGESLLSEQR